MTQHVRMDGETYVRYFTGTGNYLPHGPGCHRAFALSHEDIRRIRIVAYQFPQSAELRPTQRVCRRASVLPPGHVQNTLFQVNLIPT